MYTQHIDPIPSEYKHGRAHFMYLDTTWVHNVVWTCIMPLLRNSKYILIISTIDTIDIANLLAVFPSPSPIPILGLNASSPGNVAMWQEYYFLLQARIWRLVHLASTTPSYFYILQTNLFKPIILSRSIGGSFIQMPISPILNYIPVSGCSP